MDWWQLPALVLTLVAGIVVPIALYLHKSGQARSERNVKRLDDHIVEDVKAHEIIVRVETLVDRHEDEIDKLRKGMHDFKDEAKRSFWELLDGRFRDFRDEIRGWLRKDGQ